MQASLPANEGQRLDALNRYDLSGLSEQVYRDLTGLAARLFDCPVATISLVHETCQVFHAPVGLSVSQTGRDVSFCAHAILQPEDVFVIPDATLDPRFADNLLVTGEFGLRFYAGVPLVTSDGLALGSLCVIDFQPRVVDAGQVEALRALGRQVMAQMDLRRHVAELERAEHALAFSSELLADTNTLLAQASHRFQELFQGLPVACFCYDADGRIYEWNRACESLYGWQADEVLQKTLYDTVCTPDSVEPTRHIVEQVFAGQSFEGLEWADRRPDGSIRYVLNNTFPLRRADGEIAGAVSASVDISARKAAEDAHRRSEKQLRAVITSAPLVLFALNKDGVFTLSEGRALRGLGLEPGEVVGTSVFDLYRDDPLVLNDCRRALSGEAFSRAVEAAGRFYETWYTPAQDDAGGVIGVSFDISERVQAEQALKTAYDDMERRVSERTAELAGANAALHEQIAERYETEVELQRVLMQSEQLLASITSILIGVDENGTVTAWNTAAQRAFGPVSADVLDRPFTDCGVVWEWERVRDAARECRQTQSAVRVDDVRYTRPDGRERFLGMSLNPITTYTGAGTGFLLLATDVTDRKALEGQLAQAQKLESIGQLAAGIAHEINTPIQYIGDNIRFLQDGFGDLAGLLDAYAFLADAARSGAPVPPETVAATNAAVQSADLDYLRVEIPSAVAQSLEGVERVAHIVRAMKEFSHPGTAQKTAVDLNHALDSTLTVARNEWKYVADLHTDFDPSLPPVPCLPGELHQVFLNVIVNAAHAISDVVGDGGIGRGTLSVSTRRAGQWAEVRISDTGTGIPDSVRAKIFDPFFTTKDVGKGTGQGLAISHAVVVEKHGGTIDVETEVGSGSTFVIRLPLVIEVMQEAA